MPPGGAVFGFQPYKSTEKQLCAFSAVKTFVASVNIKSLHVSERLVNEALTNTLTNHSVFVSVDGISSKLSARAQRTQVRAVLQARRSLTRKPRDELPQTVAVTHVSDTARGGDTLTVS